MAALYTSAAKVLDKALKKKGTVKSLVIENGFPNKKKLYALVCETLKCKCEFNHLKIKIKNYNLSTRVKTRESAISLVIFV